MFRSIDQNTWYQFAYIVTTLKKRSTIVLAQKRRFDQFECRRLPINHADIPVNPHTRRFN